VADYGNVSPQGEGKRRQSELNRLSDRQEGLISLAQLRSLGFTVKEIEARVRRGDFESVHRGVYLVARPRVYGRGHLFAALLAVGDDAFLSHRTAAAAHGLRPIAPSHLEVSVSRKARPRTGLIIHRTGPPHPGEIVRRFGLRYSSFPRLLIELAASETPVEIDRLITQAIRKGAFNPQALAAAIDRHSRRPGVAIAKAAAGRYLDRTDRSSELEYSFDTHAQTDPRIPPYRTNVHLGPYEFDCVFDAQRLVVELDGRPYHAVLRDIEKDNAKNTWLQLHRFRILRITDFTWKHDRTSAIADLLALLATGDADQRAA
jgi:very-short-patch-repair endonuclease